MKKGWLCFVLLYNTQRSVENTQEIKKNSDREPTQAGWLEFVFISWVLSSLRCMLYNRTKHGQAFLLFVLW